MAGFRIECDTLAVVALEKPVPAVRLRLKDAELIVLLAEGTVGRFPGVDTEADPLK